MVRILENGDIVADNDPRAQQSSHSGNAPRNRAGRMGYVHDNSEPHQYGHQGQGAGVHQGQQVSVFQSLNQRLIGLGIPSFNIGTYRIEPLVTVGFLLAMLFFGLPGLLFAGLLFGVVIMSGGGGDNDGDSGGGSGAQHRQRAGRVLRHR
ncbi:protein FAM241B-like [Asterias amurensis]|uniref:protein FAM241B-like n=1 Tax=Asterias amurensis TaxID=7602 RepID=UPI003AB7740C